MPSSRNRRRAQSQAQLSGRRRNRGGRRQRGSSVSQQSRRRTAPAPEATAANGPDQVANQAAVQTAVQATPEAPAATPAPEAANIIRRRPTRARTPAEPLQMYPYLRSELTRIGVLTALIAVALGVLTFVLG